MNAQRRILREEGREFQVIQKEALLAFREAGEDVSEGRLWRANYKFLIRRGTAIEMESEVKGLKEESDYEELAEVKVEGLRQGQREEEEDGSTDMDISDEE